MYRIQPALAPALYIPGVFYETLVRARNKMYSEAILPQRRLPAPVISIGNITMGGSGKTPLVIHVSQILLKMGFAPAVLTRGYGRMRPREPQILAPGETPPTPSLTLGDEPALIRRHVPSAWMGVSKDRFNAGSILVKRDTRLAFVLDDGFQHRRLHRDLDIVIIDSSQPLGSNRIFPRGTLREPLAGLRRCDIIVVNSPLARPDPIEEQIRAWNPAAGIFRCRQAIRRLIPFAAWKNGSADCVEAPRGPAFLASALGNPGRFLRDTQQLGIGVAGARFFSDHYRPSLKEWQDCAERARRAGAQTIITTEKDAIKIAEPPDFPLLVAVQSTEMADAGAFELALRKCIEETR